MTRNQLRRLELDNGLRVLLAPNSLDASIGIAVHYGVGFRTEPVGHTGLAHLFEHLMFQGGYGAAPQGYLPRLQRIGGSGNARTRQDVTVYHAAAPASAMETLLELEADRMGSPRLTEQNLSTQVSVIDEEIRLMVHNRPYGRFPWMLPLALHRRVANTRDGYGETADLAAVDIALCEKFFADHYGPGNAVVTLTGAFDPATAERSILRHFGPLPARPAVPVPDTNEPLTDAERRRTVADRHAGTPALAVGYRMPDPMTERADYLAHLVLAALLGQGRRALLRRGPTAATAALSLSVTCGLFGLPLDTAGPDVLTLFAVHEDERDAENILAALDDTLRALANTGVEAGLLRATTARWAAGALRELGDPGMRAQLLGLREILFGEAETTFAVARSVCTEVTAEQVSRAAARLRAAGRAIVRFVPEASEPRCAA